MVIGMDWLEHCGPMLVDWAAKTLEFQHKGVPIRLQGLTAAHQTVDAVSVTKLHDWERSNSIAHVVMLCISGDQVEITPVPATIQQVLDKFQDIFKEPTTLPQHREWGHALPLLPGAKPVNIRPYRYTPEQKNEIEAQVKEMLAKGFITPSLSPFSSPVLLVKKKDQTWRFCVDFRHLNAITLKATYPMPVIEELLDELAGAY